MKKLKLNILFFFPLENVIAFPKRPKLMKILKCSHHQSCELSSFKCFSHKSISNCGCGITVLAMKKCESREVTNVFCC